MPLDSRVSIVSTPPIFIFVDGALVSVSREARDTDCTFRPIPPTDYGLTFSKELLPGTVITIVPLAYLYINTGVRARSFRVNAPISPDTELQFDCGFHGISI